MDLMTIIGLAAAAGIFYLVAFPSGKKTNKAEQRANRMTGHEPEKPGLFAFLKPEESNARRRQIEESLQDIERRQKNKKKSHKSLKAKIKQANWKIAPQVLLSIWLLIGLTVAFFMRTFGLEPIFYVGAVIVIGLGIPHWLLGMAIKRRQKKFTENFADAMDIIVRGVRSGLPLGDCLKVIAHETPQPVAGEFFQVVQAEAVGVPLEISLEQLYERMPVPEISFFNTVLNIQKTTGGNLGESLDNLSKVLRGRKMLREKIKALSAEARMSAIIIGAMPPLMMVLITIMSPEYMTELYTTSTGQRNLMIGGSMMVVGTLVMKKMINFKM